MVNQIDPLSFAVSWPYGGDGSVLDAIARLPIVFRRPEPVALTRHQVVWNDGASRATFDITGWKMGEDGASFTLTTEIVEHEGCEMEEAKAAAGATVELMLASGHEVTR